MLHSINPTAPSALFHAGLRSLRASRNRLQSLPAGLSCPSLTHLDLSDNPRLRLTRADVDCLLAHLPRLRQLDARGGATSADVMRYADDMLSPC